MPPSHRSSPQTLGGRPKTDLGEILVEVGVITPAQLEQATTASGRSPRDLAKHLVDLGFSTEEKIMKGIGIKAKVPYFTSLEGLYTQESANLISEELARRLQVVPLFRIENVVTVAMVNPLDVFTIDALVKTTGYRVDPVVCMRTTIFDTINKLYAGMEGMAVPTLQPQGGDFHVPSGDASSSDMVIEYSPSTGSGAEGSPGTPVQQIRTSEDFDLNKIMQEVKNRLPEAKVGQLDLIQKDIKKASEDMPIVQLVDAIFKQAVSKKASDIHLEPHESDVEVRFRIDGVMRTAMNVPKDFESAIVARIKVMANLDITEVRQPQDGRVVTEVANRPVDLRISTLPLIQGEKVVIRILDKGSREFKFSILGFSSANEKIFMEALHQPNGIILATGPTGSGKSTTLYTALTILDSPEHNIITLEDPVEYQIKGVNQVQVNPKVGLTFAKGLRSVLRQDPDIIMVGEIRDQETAEIAIQAALTGHLVLSTLHTNDAPSAITRLINMKVEPFLISASVLLVVAQRLIRVLCKGCREPYQVSETILEKLRIHAELSATPTFYQAKGCNHCHQTGYNGRRGLYEILRMTSHLREMAVAGKTLDEFRAAAKEQGMRSLFEEGTAMVCAGETSIEEMLRVCRLED